LIEPFDLAQAGFCLLKQALVFSHLRLRVRVERALSTAIAIWLTSVFERPHIIGIEAAVLALCTSRTPIVSLPTFNGSANSERMPGKNACVD